MTFLSRLLRTEPDPKDALRPLWHRVVGVARTPALYSECGVADTLDGRFDMLTTVLAVTMIRMERDEDTVPASARLAELFVEDMDGQLRESGMGDPTVGKQIGKLMSALGGRTGALREGLANEDDALLIAAVERNVTFGDSGSPECVARKLRGFAATIAAMDYDELLQAELSL